MYIVVYQYAVADKKWAIYSVLHAVQQHCISNTKITKS